MVTSPENLNPESVETENIVEEFKKKVLQSFEKEKNRLREIAEKDSKLILTKAYQESANLTTKAQEESQRIIESAKTQANREVESILAKGQERANQIVANAEEITRKEAKERTKKEVENIIRGAREEAAKQLARTLQQAKDEAGLILAEAQKKAEEEKGHILEAARRNANEKAEKEAREIVAQAKIRIEKERESLLASAMSDAKRAAEAETSHILVKARQDAETIVNEARHKVSIQLEESSRLMLEINQKMQQVIGIAGLDMKKSEPRNNVPPVTAPPSPTPVLRQEKTIPVSAPVPVDEMEIPEVNNPQNKINTIFYDDENRTYQGKLKIDIAPPVDSEQITHLEQNLLKSPNLRVLGKGGTEDGSAWIEIDINKPAPLIDILRKIPSVKDVVGAKSYIIVALKTKQLV